MTIRALLPATESLFRNPADESRQLERAAAHCAEVKRLLLAMRPRILHRRTWLTLETLAEACSHIVVAIERLNGERR